MAENQRNWGRPTHYEEFDQYREEQRRREEEQHRYPGFENRYNTPGYNNSEYGAASNWSPQDRDRGQYGYGQGSAWGATHGSRYGTSVYGSKGYGSPGFAGGYGSRQQYGSGLGSAGSWGGASGAMGGTEYGTSGEFRRSSFGSEYPGVRFQGQPGWPEDQQYFGNRGLWDKSKHDVSSWYGDEEERRRELDRRMLNREENRRGMEEYGQGRYGHIPMLSHRGKGPRAYKRSDERIKEDISDRLADDERIDASDIEIDVHNAEVTLIGTVDSRESKRRVEDIVEMVSGVQHVQNNIRVNREGASVVRTGQSNSSKRSS